MAIQSIINYNIDEEYLYEKPYCFIKGFAVGKKFKYTLRALPLARMMHDGQHRKGLVEVRGKKVNLPYVLHVLKVCSTLINLNLPLTEEEQDILYTCALLHDVLEDASDYFPMGGIELIQEYGFPKEVLEIVLLLSKNQGASEEELNDYFNRIKSNKFALLVKLADRSHNVEDLHNMKNIPKYIKETKTYIYMLCSYGKSAYPELSEGITTLKSKIVSLTEEADVMNERFVKIVEEKDSKIKELENRIKELEERLDK